MPIPVEDGELNRSLQKLISTLIGGLDGVVFLTAAYRRQGLNEKAERRFYAAEERELYNERFATAAEQLGPDKARVRLDGVYAMADLADDCDDGQQTCVNVLCATVKIAGAGHRVVSDRSLVPRHLRRCSLSTRGPLVDCAAG